MFSPNKIKTTKIQLSHRIIPKNTKINLDPTTRQTRNLLRHILNITKNKKQIIIPPINNKLNKTRPKQPLI